MNKFYGPLFTFCRWLVSIFYRKYSVEKLINVDGPVVFVSHHQNMHGPFVTLLSFPKHLHCWVLHVFLDKEECFKQYSEYTFSKRFGWPSYLAKLVAFPVSRFIPRLIHSGQAIPVYRGHRKILDTFKESITALKRNEGIVIFPDVDYSNSSARVGDLYDGFLFIEKYYYRETGKHVSFVPIYASKTKKEILSGNPIRFRDDLSFNEERKAVLKKIQNELNQLAIQSGDQKTVEKVS